MHLIDVYLAINIINVERRWKEVLKSLKKIIPALLVVGMLTAGAGIANAAGLSITANVQTDLALTLGESALTFSDLKPGTPSAAQTVTATTTGSESYQLTLTGANLTGTGGTILASALQFKDSAASTYKNASTAAQEILASVATANFEGDEQSFDLRILAPANTANGAYAGNITITATPK